MGMTAGTQRQRIGRRDIVRKPVPALLSVLQYVLRLSEGVFHVDLKKAVVRPRLSKTNPNPDGIAIYTPSISASFLSA